MAKSLRPKPKAAIAAKTDTDRQSKNAELRLVAARRLRMLREILGETQKRFGGRFNIKESTYSQIEKGDRLVPVLLALKLRDKYTVSLDWLYGGDPSNIADQELRKAIISVQSVR